MICDTSTISVNVRVLLKEMILKLVLNILTHCLVVITCLVPDTPNQRLFQISEIQNLSRAQNSIINTTEVISIFSFFNVILQKKVNKMCSLKVKVVK